MDEIIKQFEKLSQNTSTKPDIDLLISQINNIEIDNEWKKMKTNYNQLRHFEKLIKNMNQEYFEKNILKAFVLFLEKIDSINQYYLSEINFDTDLIVLEYLEKSLNTNDPFKKLEYSLHAYSDIFDIIVSKKRKYSE